jgi:dolichol-phosphate mannosyltransferase
VPVISPSQSRDLRQTRPSGDVSGSPLLSVVVPTRNEAGNVRVLWERLNTALEGVRFELCVVDDSDDETPAVLDRLSHDAHALRSVHRTGQQRAGGLSTAVVEGLRMATGEYVCVMDADLQHPPELIPQLLAAAENGADLVVASRYQPGGSRSGLNGTLRHLVSRGATAVARVVFSEARLSGDPLSGFFLCRRVLIDGIEFRPVGFKILLELLVCVPGIRVRDVPLQLDARQSGVSKAGISQGLLFLRHCASLFVYAAGSARYWKFGIAGVSGLGVFLPVLWSLSDRGGWNPLVAFVPAFLLSLSWNGLLNWRWTFADQQRSGGRAAQRYVLRALLAGLVMFGVYAALLVTGLPLVGAGLTAALVAMLLNGVLNRRSVRRHLPHWSRLPEDSGVQAALRRVAGEVGADRAYLMGADGERRTGLPRELLSQVVEQRRPMLVTEAASHRPQRRSNIDRMSRLLVPVVDGAGVSALLVCERSSPTGFGDEALSSAVLEAEKLVPMLREDQRKS